jgi:hypothetical protein
MLVPKRALYQYWYGAAHYRYWSKLELLVFTSVNLIFDLPKLILVGNFLLNLALN